MFWILADAIVLAVNAPHVAIAEEDGSGASAARDNWLLAMVVASCGDYG